MLVKLSRPWYAANGVLHPEGMLEYNGDPAVLPSTAKYSVDGGKTWEQSPAKEVSQKLADEQRKERKLRDSSVVIQTVAPEPPVKDTGKGDAKPAKPKSDKEKAADDKLTDPI